MQPEAHARGVARMHGIDPSIQQRHELLKHAGQLTAARPGLDQSSEILNDPTQFAREAHALFPRFAPTAPQHSRREAIRGRCDGIQPVPTPLRQAIDRLVDRDGRKIDPSRRGILRIRQLLNGTDIGDDDTRNEPARLTEHGCDRSEQSLESRWRSTGKLDPRSVDENFGLRHRDVRENSRSRNCS